VREDGGKIAEDIERLGGVGKTADGIGFLGGAGKDGGVAGRNIGRKARGGRSGGQAFHDGNQETGADGLGQNVRDTAQKGFFLPVGLGVRGEGDDGGFGIAPTEAFDDPDTFHAHEIAIKNAGADQSVNEQRFAFLDVETVDNAVLIRAQSRPYGFGEIRMGR
jgi:hypothetical protein